MATEKVIVVWRDDKPDISLTVGKNDITSLDVAFEDGIVVVDAVLGDGTLNQSFIPRDMIRKVGIISK